MDSVAKFGTCLITLINTLFGVSSKFYDTFACAGSRDILFIYLFIYFLLLFFFFFFGGGGCGGVVVSRVGGGGGVKINPH